MPIRGDHADSAMRARRASTPGDKQGKRAQGLGDSPTNPHTPDRDVARPRNTALTKRKELSEDGTRHLQTRPVGRMVWQHRLRWLPIDFQNNKPHAKTPVDAAMIRNT